MAALCASWIWKKCDGINVSWISSLISKLPHAPHFQNCHLLYHNGIDDVKIHICMWDAFMPVYSVFEAFTALPLCCTGLECNQRGKQSSHVSAKKKKKKGEENSIRMCLCAPPEMQVQSSRGMDWRFKKIWTLPGLTTNILTRRKENFHGIQIYASG